MLSAKDNPQFRHLNPGFNNNPSYRTLSKIKTSHIDHEYR
jgi:hypothetical protein